MSNRIALGALVLVALVAIPAGAHSSYLLPNAAQLRHPFVVTGEEAGAQSRTHALTFEVGE